MTDSLINIISRPTGISCIYTLHVPWVKILIVQHLFLSIQNLLFCQVLLKAYPGTIFWFPNSTMWLLCLGPGLFQNSFEGSLIEPVCWINIKCQKLICQVTCNIIDYEPHQQIIPLLYLIIITGKRNFVPVIKISEITWEISHSKLKPPISIAPSCHRICLSWSCCIWLACTLSLKLNTIFLDLSENKQNRSGYFT